MSYDDHLIAERRRVAVLEYAVLYIPEESSSEEESFVDNEDASAVEAGFLPKPVDMLKKKTGRKKEAHKSALLSRADFEMPDVYEKLKMYMKMLFDFVRTHPHIKGKSNERNFTLVFQRAIAVLNDVVRSVSPTGNYVSIDKEPGVKYSKLWDRLAKIVSYMLDYDETFEILAKTYAFYTKKPVRHNYQNNTLRALTRVFFSSTPGHVSGLLSSTKKADATRIRIQSPFELAEDADVPILDRKDAPAAVPVVPLPVPAAEATPSVPAAETAPAEKEFVPKLSAIEFAEINKKLIDLHEFLVGASADSKAAIDMTNFSESATNDPWIRTKRRPF